jgi:hypothetical protein
MSDKVRKQDGAMRREQAGVGEDVSEQLTCESALREAGISEALIAKKLKEQLEAKQPRWNPEKKAFELFPDHDARRAALREAIKILGGYPSVDDTSHDGNVVVDLGMLTPKQFRQPAPTEGSASR